ncbi:hypothetical protein PDE01_36620 [Paracoccus denitrificans]|nr:hypothetical protein PDE01_36620 [Paracoccus denitrificans]
MRRAFGRCGRGGAVAFQGHDAPPRIGSAIRSVPGAIGQKKTRARGRRLRRGANPAARIGKAARNDKFIRTRRQDRGPAAPHHGLTEKMPRQTARRREKTMNQPLPGCPAARAHAAQDREKP